jgi:pimeloyl-ACP methyl ester carboxylesterase
VEIGEFETHRRYVRTRLGELSYTDVGDGPVVFFVHGVCFNAHIWRDAIGALSSERRCIAVDLPAHGFSISQPEQDLSLRANAERLDVLLEELDIAAVDVVGNDTGGALCQIFTVRYPKRVRTLTLTNCDADDNLPPAEFQEGKALAEAGQLGALVGQMGDNPELARNAERGFNLTFEHPEALSDEVIRAYIGAFTDPKRASELDRFVVSTTVEDLLAVKAGLKNITIPTFIVWGTGDIFFEVEWAYWLRDHIPGAMEVVELDGAKLLFPAERPDEFVLHLRRFLDEHSPIPAAMSRHTGSVHQRS